MAYKKNVTQASKEVKEQTDESVVVIAADNDISVTETENDKLRAELENMKSQMALLMKMVGEQTNSTPTPTFSTRSERNIPFVNLTSSTFVIQGTHPYELKGQFAKRSFTEHEAQTIVNNMQNAIRQGYIYIADADFVKKCDLEDVYKDLLSDKDMMSLLTHEPSYVVDIYKSASNGQKNIIVDMIKNKKLSSEKVDANVLMEIGSLCGQNLMEIEPLQKEE